MSYSEWIKCKISDLGEIVSGGTPSTKIDDNWDGSISWITPRDLSGYNDRFISRGERMITNKGLNSSSARVIPGGSILFSSRAPIGYVAIASNELTTNQGFKSIVPNTKNYNLFIYYLLKYKTNDIKSIAGGSTFSEISGSAFKNIIVKVPNLKEQKAIANILSSLDDKIELNNKINKNLEELAQTLYKRWFVDFEFPNENGEPYKSSGGEMVDSELGKIPKGWDIDFISEIANIQNGFAFKAPEYSEKGIKVIRTMNIGADGYFNEDNIVYLPIDYSSNKFSQYKFKKFDLGLVMVGASIGKMGIALSNIEGALQNQNMWRFRKKSDHVSQFYVIYKIKELHLSFSNWSTGSARDFYRKDTFSKQKVVLSNQFLMRDFDEVTRDLYNIIDNNFNQNIHLKKIRDELLPKLMTGEIEVPIEE